MTQTDHTYPLTRRELLFTLWVFVMFLYAYCDILGLYDVEILNKLLSGSIDGIVLDQTMLLAAAVLMILPITTILVTRIASYRVARLTNIGVGSLKTLVMVATLMTPCTVYYWLFAIIEISTTIAIVWLAWGWQKQTNPLANTGVPV